MLADPWPFLAQVPLEAAAAERMRRRSYRFGSAHCRRCGDWDIHPDWKCHGAGPHALPAGPGYQHYVLDSEGNHWTTCCTGCDLVEGIEYVLGHFRTLPEVQGAVAAELRR